MNQQELELGILPDRVEYSANDHADEWMYLVTELLGEPKEVTERVSSSDEIFQSVRYRLKDTKGNPSISFTIWKWNTRERSFFHSVYERTDNNLAIHVPDASILAIDFAAGSLRLTGNGPANPNFQFTLFKTGKWTVLG